MAPSFKKRHFCKYHSNSKTKSKNPYSNQGLDTFEDLLRDLEEKRKKIYTKNDLGGVSLVRFTYTSSNNLVPIIIKNKDSEDTSPGREEWKDRHWRRPSYYMPAVLMVMLVLLVFFGRSVAIVCTSIVWYIVPALGTGLGEEDRRVGSGEKKFFRRIWGDSRIMHGDGLSEKRNQRLRSWS